MFEGSRDAQSPGPGAGSDAGAALDAEAVQGWLARLTDGTLPEDDAARIDLLRALEVLKCAAEGAQAVVTAAFETSQRHRAAEQGVPTERRGRGIAHQVALARRVSPHRGQRLTGLATVLTREMPHTLAALRAGAITEWSATLLARETACLELPDRHQIDHLLCGDQQAAARMGPRELGDRAAALAAQADPAAVAARRRKAEADRHVTLRPAPDTMTWLTGHLPVKDGVAVWAALKAEADRLAGTADGRSRGQVMADTLVDRVLGRTTTHSTGTDTGAGGPAAPVLRVNVVVPLASLAGASEAGGQVPGHGPVPAEAIREWITTSRAAGTRVELRRLFADPATGQLVALESKARLFPAALAELIALRDQRCRTPWCNAPVRHTDHVEDHADGGPTSLANGQGLCEACNHAKQAPGWEAHPRPGPTHQVVTTTPTGHTHTSTPPETDRLPYRQTRPGLWTLIA